MLSQDEIYNDFIDQIGVGRLFLSVGLLYSNFNEVRSLGSSSRGIWATIC